MTQQNTPSFRRAFVAACCALCCGGLALSPEAEAHGEKAHAATGPVKKEQKPWGIAGDTRAVRRTITVRMGDDMRFRPDRIEVREGETVRLVMHNEGKLMHEFVIGTPPDLAEHAALMVKFPDMEHDEPYMAHVPPGKSGTIVWHFNRPGDFQFACLIAGHFQSGMVGALQVAPRAAAVPPKTR